MGESNPHQRAADAYFAAMRAKCVGNHVHVFADGMRYFFFRGKVNGQSGPGSTPRAIIIVQPDGTSEPIRPITSYERKRIQAAVKSHERRERKAG